MELITIRTQIRNVARRWRAFYQNTQLWDAARAAIADKLDVLNPETATAEDVRNIIGNDSWACAQWCEECDQRKETLVEVGDDYVCADCLRAAAALCEEL